MAFLLLQLLCAVLAIRASNFRSVPEVTSYSTPAYASFAAPPFSAPSQAFSSFGAPTYSSYVPAPFVTKNFGESLSSISPYSTQNAPIIYSRPTITAAPVNSFTSSPYSNYPQRTPITTFSASGPVTYTYPTLSYSSLSPFTTYTAPAIPYNG